jgi:hypothetical protein
MSTTPKAARASVHGTTTTPASPYARATTRSGTHYLGFSKALLNPTSESGKKPRPSVSEGSIWGWVERIHWSSDVGYWTTVEAIDETAPWSPPPPDDE